MVLLKSIYEVDESSISARRIAEVESVFEESEREEGKKQFEEYDTRQK